MPKLASGVGCPTHKIKFASRHKARKAAHSMQPYLGRMHPYRCPYCGWHHIGHERKRGKQKIRA